MVLGKFTYKSNGVGFPTEGRKMLVPDSFGC